MDVDEIYVINLEKDHVRKKKFERYFSNLKVTWYTPKPHPNGGKQGCYESHRNIIESARKKGQKRILIMEDDAFPLKPLNFIIRTTNKALKQLKQSQHQWDFLLLGFFPYRTKKTDMKNVLQVHQGSCSQSYIVNLESIPKIKKYEEVKEHVDIYFFFKEKGGFRTYAVQPMLIFQNSHGDSNISPLSTLQRYETMLNFGCDKTLEISSICNISAFITLCVLFFLLLILFIITYSTCNKKQSCYVCGFLLLILIIATIVCCLHT